MDFNTTLRNAMRTGEVTLGQNGVRDAVQNGRAKLVILAKNCPVAFRQYIEGIKDLNVQIYKGTGMELGKACGKPFGVSALAVIDPGESDIMALKEG